MTKVFTCCAFAVIFGAVHAQTISTYNEYFLHPLQDYTEFTQSFDAAGPTLLDYQFNLTGDSTNGPLSIAIFQWSASTFYGAPVGTALYSTTITRPTATQDIFLNNIDVPMTTGVNYGVIFQTHGNLLGSLALMEKTPTNDNPTGNLFTWDIYTGRYDSYGYDTEFKATFGNAVPEAPPVAIVGLGLVGLLLRRKR